MRPRTEFSTFVRWLCGVLSLVLLATQPGCPSNAAVTSAGTGDVVVQPEPQPKPISFSCADEPVNVSLAGAMEHLPVTDVAEQRDQLRDWIWTVVRAHYAKATQVELSDELPWPLRPNVWEAGPRPLGGPSRWAFLQTGELLVMIPTGAQAAMEDAFFRAYDAAAVEHDAVERVSVYRYGEIGHDGAVWMCRLPDVERAQLRSDASGFRSASSLRTTEDLASFLAGGVDLLGASCGPNGLQLIGRHRETTARAPTTVQEVSELVSGSAAIEDDASLGFSLDPEIDPGRVSSNLRAFAAALSTSSYRDLVDGDLLAARLFQAIWSLPEAMRTLIAPEVEKLAAAVDWHGVIAAERAWGDASDPILSEIASWALDRGARQCARYDGPLRGTSSGMVMFYTDLLMKLVSQGNIIGPSELPSWIDTFVPYSACADLRSSSARLWLELDPNKLRIANGTVSYAPVVTRVSARRTILGTGDEDGNIGPVLQSGINRWEASWSEISGWEPQYEHLNQLQKWAAAASADETKRCLSFLATAHDLGLDLKTWVARDAGLRWRDAAGLALTEGPEECLPMVSSDVRSICGTQGRVSGGVSLASKEALQAAAHRAQRPYDTIMSAEPWVARAKLAGLEGADVSIDVTGPTAAPDPGAARSFVAWLGEASAVDGAALIRKSKAARRKVTDPRDVGAVLVALGRVQARLDPTDPLLDQIHQAKLSWRSHEARLTAPAARRAVPTADVVTFVRPKGADVPRPAETPPDGEWAHYVAAPELLARTRESKESFRSATASQASPATGGWNGRPHVFYEPCDDESRKAGNCD